MSSAEAELIAPYSDVCSAVGWELKRVRCSHLPLVDVDVDPPLLHGPARRHGGTDQQVRQAVGVQINGTHAGSEVRPELRTKTRTHTHSLSIAFALSRRLHCQDEGFPPPLPTLPRPPAAWFGQWQIRRPAGGGGAGRAHAHYTLKRAHSTVGNDQRDGWDVYPTFPFWWYCGAPPTTSIEARPRKLPAPTE